MPESTFKFQGEEYTFAPERDIGIAELRFIKNWFGLPLGTYNGLTAAASLGDPEAIASIIWIAQRKAGVKRIREPMNFPDFSVGEIMGSFTSENGSGYEKVPSCKLTLNGQEYTFDFVKLLTFKTLRQIKKWYPSIGSMVWFTMALFQGDPEAMACEAWILWGGPNDKSIPLPSSIDFAVGEVLDSYELEEPEEPEAPEPPALVDPLTGEEKPVDPTLSPNGENS